MSIKFKFDEIESAYEFVCGSFDHSHHACIDKKTGKVYCKSDECDDLDEFPEDFEASEDCIAIPDKYELDLGNNLVEQFVFEKMPDRADDIRNIFRGRGAYGRFKSYLQGANLLETWYDFENKKQEEALREWCEENGIELED